MKLEKERSMKGYIMHENIVLLISILVATIITLMAELFSFVIDVLYSLHKSKKTGKKQYWITGRGGKQVNELKEIIMYRLKFALFIIIFSFLLYICILICLNRYSLIPTVKPVGLLNNSE